MFFNLISIPVTFFFFFFLFTFDSLIIFLISPPFHHLFITIFFLEFIIIEVPARSNDIYFPSLHSFSSLINRQGKSSNSWMFLFHSPSSIANFKHVVKCLPVLFLRRFLYSDGAVKASTPSRLFLHVLPQNSTQDNYEVSVFPSSSIIH